MNNLTKLQLCKIISTRLNNKSVPEIKQIIELFLDEILEALAKHQRIEIRGFGVFSVKERQPRVGRNPRTGIVIKIPKYETPHFRFSKEAQNIFDVKLKK